MPKDRRLLIVIADGEHVGFVRPAADEALHTEETLQSPSAHKRSSDLWSDHPKASFHTAATANHALAQRRDPDDLLKAKFAHTIAKQLNAGTRKIRDDILMR